MTKRVDVEEERQPRRIEKRFAACAGTRKRCVVAAIPPSRCNRRDADTALRGWVRAARTCHSGRDDKLGLHGEDYRCVATVKRRRGAALQITFWICSFLRRRLSCRLGIWLWLHLFRRLFLFLAQEPARGPQASPDPLRASFLFLSSSVVP